MAKVFKEPPLKSSDGTTHYFNGDDSRYYIFCPGCFAQSKIDHPDEEKWWINSAIHCFSKRVHTFNGDMDHPTLSPSLLCRGETPRCHSYVNNGMIQFLGDCTHPLANQTVELMDVPEEYKDDN